MFTFWVKSGANFFSIWYNINNSNDDNSNGNNNNDNSTDM